MSWADQFCREVQVWGIDCCIVNRANGWPETMVIAGRICFTKSVTYNRSRGLYFQGVDPKKLDDKGDYVLICGGIDNRLRDVFLIPWKRFFETLARGEPVNTYKSPKKYWQYKFTVKGDGSVWTMFVQGGERPQMDLSNYRQDPQRAMEIFRSNQGT
jgi:hypothetical protein